MRSKRKTSPSIAEVTSYSEAIQVLNVRSVPGSYKKMISRSLDLIFKVDTKQPAGRTYVQQQLQETEADLKKVEEENLLGHQMNEMEPGENKKDEFSETEGNPPSGKENVIETSIADKSGTSAQSDGGSVDDQINKADQSGEGSKPAQSQPGISQLKEAIQQVADQGSVDPLNKAVIDYMGNGMSQVEAQNAAVMDNNMMEAVFNKKLAKILPKVLTPFVNEIANLHRTIRVYDGKIEAMRKQSGTNGLQETIQITPPGGTQSAPKTSRFETQTTDEISKDIASKYIDMG